MGDNVPVVPPFFTAGLTCPLTQSTSSQSVPFSHASELRTTPLSGVATGEGCEYLQVTLMHLTPNLHRVGDRGLVGGVTPGGKNVDAASMGVGATIGGAG